MRSTQQDLEEKLQVLRDQLQKPLRELAQEAATLTELIEKERILRSLSGIVHSKRILKPADTEALQTCTREIGQVQLCQKAIEKKHQKEFKNLHRYESQRMYLQGKEVVYKVDVELDQIMTF